MTSATRVPRRVLVLGNPNVGKTSLWNHLTGGRARVGNYPGVTVERRSGLAPSPADPNETFELIDVPGTYSLSARSAEEQIAMSSVVGTFEEAPEALLLVLDAGQLSRCLYLTLSVLELRVNTVIALNMADEAAASVANAATLSKLLGVPVVITNGRTGEGTAALLEALSETLKAPQLPKVHVRYPKWVLETVDVVAAKLPEALRRNVERDRAIAMWALSSLENDDELIGIPAEVREAVFAHRDRAEEFDLAVAVARYATIDDLLQSLHVKGSSEKRKLTEQIDAILLHPFLGLVAFTSLMIFVFQALFSWSDPLIGLIEGGITGLQALLIRALPPSIITDALVEGVVGGVGNVIVFLPQILLLFLFIGFLEDSGYMARVAYLMDRVMRSLGLHGRAFVPMMSGFACAVPAILSTRTLERKRDQLLTMMVVPLTTCSARLPVYSVVIGALLPAKKLGFFPVQGLLLAGMYLLSLVTSLVAAWVIGRLVIKGKQIPLLLELPPYRLPRIVPTLKMMQEKATQFLTEAGTIILVATVVLWGLLHFPRPSHCTWSVSKSDGVSETRGAQSSPGTESSGAPTELAPEERNLPACTAQEGAKALENSYGGRLGRTIEPYIEPLGFDWKIGTGIIFAFAAREVFVSTLALVYGVADDSDDALPLRDKIRQERLPDGEPRYRALTGLSLLIFFAFACQCMSTLAVVRRETRSFRWPLFLFSYMSVLAYGASLLVFQVGRLLGF